MPPLSDTEREALARSLLFGPGMPPPDVNLLVAGSGFVAPSLPMNDLWRSERGLQLADNAAWGKSGHAYNTERVVIRNLERFTRWARRWRTCDERLLEILAAMHAEAFIENRD